MQGSASICSGASFAWRGSVQLRMPPPAAFDLAGDIDRWCRLMRRGDYEGAWTISDAMLATGAGPGPDEPRHTQRIWRGAPLDGRRVLVRCYRGLGDTIQFIRYAPLIRQRAAELTVWAQPTLLPLLAGADGIDRLIPVHNGDVGVDFDVDLEVMELPYAFRTTLERIPCDVPYLHVAPAVLPSSGRQQVGIVWRSGDWIPHRSIPFALLEPLIEEPVRWYVLQGQPGLSECPPDLGIVAGTTDILELAGVMRSLDLVITIDSMTAHLAGALGTRVWTLLPAEADWRWLEGRDDSPWYPTMRLFRQERQGEWEGVIERVRAALRAEGKRDKGKGRRETKNDTL